MARPMMLPKDFARKKHSEGVPFNQIKEEARRYARRKGVTGEPGITYAVKVQNYFERILGSRPVLGSHPDPRGSFFDRLRGRSK